MDWTVVIARCADEWREQVAEFFLIIGVNIINPKAAELANDVIFGNGDFPGDARNNVAQLPVDLGCSVVYVGPVSVS